MAQLKALIARKEYRCAGSNCSALIQKYDRHVKMYGASHWETPYNVRICMKCAKESTDKKVQAAIKEVSDERE